MLTATIRKPGRARAGTPLAVVALAAVLAPLPAALPEQDGLADGEQLHIGSIPTRLHFPSIAIRRDPFAGSPDASGAGMRSGDLESEAIPLPPNAGASAPVLEAIVLGAAPKALVETGGRVTIVGIGDALADSIVVEISRSSVLLDDGVRLQLPEHRP